MNDAARVAATRRLFADVDPAGPGCSAAVFRRGEVVYAEAFGLRQLEPAEPMTTDTVLDIGSTSKQFTATAIGLLALRGDVELSAAVDTYLPTLAPWADDVTVGNLISGAGTLVKQGANTVTLSAINTHTGGATVAAGVLRGWTDSALGAPGVGTVVVSNNATLDRGWGTVGPIIVSGNGADGNGAIVNNSSGNMVGDWVGGMTPSLTLTGDTMFGGNTRWDLGSSTGDR